MRAAKHNPSTSGALRLACVLSEWLVLAASDGHAVLGLGRVARFGSVAAASLHPALEGAKARRSRRKAAGHRGGSTRAHAVPMQGRFGGMPQRKNEQRQGLMVMAADLPREKVRVRVGDKQYE